MNYKYINYNLENIPIYSRADIENIRKPCLLAYELLNYIKPFIKPGVTTAYIDDLCHEFIVSHKAYPAPLNYNGFPKSTCISVNHVICHGIPSTSKVLESTDIFNLDVTIKLDGFYGDASKMFTLGNPTIKAQRLIEITHKCLMESIYLIKPGAFLGDIGAKIQEIAHKNNFSVVEDFCGHGIGHKFHQAPQVLHFGEANTGLKLQEGMVFTIEPMINSGNKASKVLSDGWTAVTRDRSLSSQFEHTIAVTKSGYEILTLPKLS